VWLIRQAAIPRLDRIAVEATPFGPKIRQDVGACFPSAKAAIDGLVHAGVLPDDTPDHVCSLTFHQPRRGPHGLHLLIVDLADLPPEHGTYQAKLVTT
jgi:glycine/serine hydroxymethyltransferase